MFFMHYCFLRGLRKSLCIAVITHRDIRTHTEGQINHCAGCTMGGPPHRQGPPINCQIFTVTFEHLNVFSVGLNITATTKKRMVLRPGTEGHI